MRQTLLNQERLCSIDTALADIVARRPALADIATAFALLAKAREAAAQALPGQSLLGAQPAVAELATGRPLLAELLEGLHTLPDEIVARLHAASALMLPAAAQAFPALAQDLARVAVLLKGEGPGAGRELVAALLAAIAPGPEDAAPARSIEALAQELGLSAIALHVAATESFMALLFHESSLLAGLVEQESWRRPYCPVCGGGADVGILKEGKEDSEFLVAKAGQLWLHCGQCAALWRFPRLRCVACGCEDPQQMELLVAEGGQREEQERAHLCLACKTYGTTLNMVDRSDPVNLEMLCMTLLPLDLLAQERGFMPLAPSPWNILS